MSHDKESNQPLPIHKILNLHSAHDMMLFLNCENRNKEFPFTGNNETVLLVAGNNKTATSL